LGAFQELVTRALSTVAVLAVVALAGCGGGDGDDPTEYTCEETSRSSEKLRATAEAIDEQIKEEAPKVSEFAGGAKFWEAEIDGACAGELRAEDRPYAHFIEED
jgi:hypothetical protein